MKKITSLLLVVIMMIGFIVTFTACVEEHEHTYETSWSKNDDYHWYGCEYDNCNKSINKEKHSYDNITSLNDSFHKMVCKCGAEKEENHSWGEVETVVGSSDFPDGTKIQTCKICGEEQIYTPNHQVSQEKWIDSINLTLLDNVTLTGRIKNTKEQDIPMTIKVDGNKSYEYMQFPSGNNSYNYYNVTENGIINYHKYSYSSMWTVSYIHDFAYSAEIFLSFLPLYDKYTEFTFNKETQCYETGAIVCESVAFGTLYYESIVIQFEDEKLVYILAIMQESFKTSEGGSSIIEYEFFFSDYGATVVTLPVI